MLLVSYTSLGDAEPKASSWLFRLVVQAGAGRARSHPFTAVLGLGPSGAMESQQGH